ncbi:MAG: metallophosphoesterase [Bacteroidaceae bacterium]|nr:metallophosphoesterase [Bacteroidaceae bacterium]
MRGVLYRLMLSAAFVLLISSCATLSGNGVGRIKHYTIESDRLPASFDGFTAVFLSDLHFPSKFTPKRLQKVAACLSHLAPDAIFMGGDYVPSPQYAQELFSSFSSVETACGRYAVLGNHDYRLRDTIAVAMERSGVRLLADEVVYLQRGGDSIAVVGVYNPFKPSTAVQQLAVGVQGGSFTIILSHTPDFAQDTRVPCDLVLAGHTHGGQVSLLGLYTPVKNTKYGTRFLRGLNSTTDGVPVITTNGVGTSRRKLRFCVPSEIVVITFKRMCADK